MNLKLEEMSYTKTIIVITVLFLMVGVFTDILFSVIKGETLSEIITKISTFKYFIKNLIQAIIMGIIFTFLMKGSTKKK
jgi:uncharacterized membrane protein YedE/YeeE